MIYEVEYIWYREIQSIKKKLFFIYLICIFPQIFIQKAQQKQKYRQFTTNLLGNEIRNQLIIKYLFIEILL